MSRLAALASQHHLSEYSRIKFGDKGCPVAYAPLSVHAPDVVRGLRERQEKYLDQVLWWPCPPVEQPLGESAPQLQQELASALSESIYPSQVKTSESHPINISQIIPPESLLAISSHLTPAKKPSPVLFQVHFPYSLERIAACPQLTYSRSDTPALPTRPPPLSRKHSSIAGALNAARISLPPLPVPSSKILTSLKRNLKMYPASDGAPKADVAPVLEPPLFMLPSYPLHPCSPPARPPTASSSYNKNHPKPFKLGNLLLSSCPGKKVRLSGPVRGRSAVCRDLDIDLRRMRLLGARCVVCCLDDAELELLIGVSWLEYCQVVHQVGLDVLRIPLPEGLTPLSPESLDADLDRIIERYTLHGISVLAHCRGGVGRAGLFACCWMLKLGLCGWIETDVVPLNNPDPEIMRNDDPPQALRDGETDVRRDTLHLVKRVIEVVRRRRSVKAIETLEQVQFLVEYVDYLRTRSRASEYSARS